MHEHKPPDFTREPSRFAFRGALRVQNSGIQQSTSNSRYIHTDVPAKNAHASSKESRVRTFHTHQRISFQPSFLILTEHSAAQG